MRTLATDEIGKSYRGRRVVNGVSLRVNQGEVVGLLGPNGAGKTTTFYTIVGLIPPDTGRVLLDEDDITDVPMYLRARQYGISYLPQEASVFRKLTVEENILAVLEAQPISWHERREKMEKLIDQLGLEHIRLNRGYALSGGERRRVEIARALCINPTFILLDEPFSGIDPIAVLDLQKIISDLRAGGIGVLITDHNVRETLSVTDRAYIINEGRIFRQGTPEQLGSDPEVRRVYLGESSRWFSAVINRHQQNINNGLPRTMVLLQPRLNLKVSQRQILTPGLVQMVSVLALNKLELKDMITAEMVENPVLEELEDSVPMIDDVNRKEEERDRLAAASTEEAPATAEEKKDPFEEIDFGSFFKDYLDPGYRSPSEMEEIERPSFENFLSKPTNLTDHLTWQLGALSVRKEVREAVELIIGNLNEDGYLIASDDELMGVAPPASPEADATVVEKVVKEAAALGLGSLELEDINADAVSLPASEWIGLDSSSPPAIPGILSAAGTAPAPIIPEPAKTVAPAPRPIYKPNFSLEDLHEALELVRQMDPPGVGCRDLRECLLAQLRFHQQHMESAAPDASKNGNGNGTGDTTAQVLTDAIAVVDQHLRGLQARQHKEIGKAINRPIEAVQAALEYIRTLDPRPGLRYNNVQPRLIEPDVAFIKHGDEWLVIMNEEDLPQLRLNPAYKRLMTRDTNDKDTRNYVKERYKSAIQLIKNIEQRKQTITKVCFSIVARQQDFLEHGIDQLKPMMIKEVAEEIGVHPSTVSRAVASKYVHTPQGVFELRYFFSESVQGPEGGGTSLLILKRRVKKLIEEEDPARPLTDEQITRILQQQGIQVTRRTVAKYREDMNIPSTHQRRVKK